MARGATSALSGSAGKLPSARRISLTTDSRVLARRGIHRDDAVLEVSSSASVRTGRTNARGSSS
jgi:hypothetical protein